MSGYRVSSSRVESPDEIEQEWCTLQSHAECSYFQSWGWISVWLKEVVAEYQPQVVRVWNGNDLVGLGIFVRRNLRRRLLVTSRALYLNEYPFDGRDMTIEYNGVLADQQHLQAVYAEMICHLLGSDPAIDEVIFGGVDASTVSLSGLDCPGCQQQKFTWQVLEQSCTWAVSLGSIGSGIEAYLNTLSKNRRAQIRRSFRLYEASGSLQLEQAETPGRALEFFSGLKELHALRWQKQGRPGAFANPVRERFYRKLIESGFAAGEIQLLKVCCDQTVIGYLYNLVWRNHVYVLQTGFVLEAEKGLMPGYVAHAMAIDHNRAAGMVSYDLMHGDEQYKKIMCKPYRELNWTALQRPRLRFGLENLLLAVKRRFI